MEVSVLGPVAVAMSGAFIALRPKELHLLATLATSPGRAVPQDVVLEELWGEGASTQRIGSLRVHLSHLRSALRAPDQPSRVTTSSAGYTLVLAAGELDADRLRAGVHAARERRSDAPEESLQILRTALSQWRGEPFGGLDSALINGRRSQLLALWRDAVTELAHLEVTVADSPDLAALVSWANQLPTHEPAHLCLARAHHRLGDTVAGLAALRRFRDGMVDEWGLDPSPEVDRVEALLLRGERIDPPVSTGPTAAAARGRNSARATAGEAAAAPRPLLDRVQPPMPPERSALVEDVLEALANGRAVVLLGAPGMGRTTVATSVACRAGAISVPGTDTTPYAAVRHLVLGSGAAVAEVESAIAGVGRATDGSADPLGPLVAAVEQAVSRTPCVVIDDADALDLDSVLVLRRALGAASSVPVFVTATDRRAALSLLEGRVSAGLVETRELAPLTSAGCARVLIGAGFEGDELSLARCAERLAAISGGHPFVASALAPWVLAPTPAGPTPSDLDPSGLSSSGQTDGVEGTSDEGVAATRPQPVGLVHYAERQRLGLSVAARAVLDLATLDDRPVAIDFLARASGHDVGVVGEALEAALSAGLLMIEPDTGAIVVHPGWRWPLLSCLGVVEARVGHATLAQAHATSWGAHAPLLDAAIAHARGARGQVPIRDLTAWLIGHGRDLLEQQGLRAAIERFEEAAALAEHHGMVELALTARLELSHALMVVGQSASGVASAQLAATHARRLSDAEAFARAAVLATTALLPDDPHRGDAADLCDEAAARLGTEPTLQRIAVLEAALRARALDPSRAGAQARAAHEAELSAYLASSGTGRDSEAESLALLGVRIGAYARASSARERWDLSERAVRAAQRANAGINLAAHRCRVADALLLDPQSSEEPVAAYRRAAERLGAPFHQWMAGRSEAARRLALGDAHGWQEECVRVRHIEAWLDPEEVLIVDVVQLFSSLWRQRAWHDLAAALTHESLPSTSLFAPVIATARVAVSVLAGERLDRSLLEVAAARLTEHSAHLPGHAFVALAAARDPAEVCGATRAAAQARLREVADEWIGIEGGLGLLGPVRDFQLGTLR